jgi:hypothetical protein
MRDHSGTRYACSIAKMVAREVDNLKIAIAALRSRGSLLAPGCSVTPEAVAPA